MISLLTAFFASFIATLLIIRFKHLHHHLSADSDLAGPQKVHTKIVPRIGGLAIAIGLFASTLLRFKGNPNTTIEIVLMLCAIPTFAIGLTEDLTKQISIRMRLFFTATSATLVVYFLQIHIVKLDIPILDFLFAIPFFGTLLTVFAITGLTNAYNIIDGFNGLSSMVGIITLIAIAYIGFLFSDSLIIFLSLAMIAAILGFFLWNYPSGLIFLGDGGAYLIGFWVATLSILLTFRHQEISPWFALLINGYPIMETLFTIYRRKIHQGKSPGQPDGIHFHTLIYRRILFKKDPDLNWLSANARTAPYLWVLVSLSVTPALLWWESSLSLIGWSLIFIITYIWLYSRIVKFKTPRWLHSLL
jgi:UDP-GlcNAc:undecaprenyl-phosphate GlcNAc-1-phosphate transferase